LVGNLPAAVSVLAILLVAGYIGGSIQFLAARGVLRRPLLAGLGRIGLTEERLEGLPLGMRRSGAGAWQLIATRLREANEQGSRSERSSSSGWPFVADIIISRPDGSERWQVTDTPADEIDVDRGPGS
jgi:hypothetical protein